MPGTVPHLCRQRWMLAAIALACLAGPTAGAFAQEPDPAPLWNAFPLNPSTSTGATTPEHPTGAPLRAPQASRTRPSAAAGDSDGGAPPLVAAIAFYGVLAALAAIGVGALTLRLLRRRTPLVTCEISWSPDEDGHAFRATAQLGGDEELVVARSRRFQRGSPEPPDYDAASHAAYDELLRNLYADGWLPYERGREWWAMRLRRTATSEPTTTRDG